MSEKGKITRAASVVSGATLLSRIGGLLRDQVTAYFFGASQAADAFFVAWRIPNLLRRLLAEGALTAAFVPVFSENLAAKPQIQTEKLFRSVFTLMALILLSVTVLGLLLAPQIVLLIAPGYTRDPDAFALTVLLTRVMFPYIFLMGLTALMTGALNALGRFAAPALGPLLVNIAIIAGALFLSPHLAIPVLGLAVGAMVGGLFQFGIQIPQLRKAGAFLGFNFNFHDPAIKKILLLMGPAALGAAVYQVSVFINTLLASLLPQGSVSWLYYADRLMQFPLGIFAVAIGTAVLPALSRQRAQNDQEGFLDTARFALGLSFFITIPAMLGLMVLAEPIVILLFQRGQFDSQSSLATAQALWGYALGLPLLSAAGLLARIFYSRGDTRTPTRVAAFSLLFGALAAFGLMWPFKHLGLALASSLASLLNCGWLMLLACRSGPEEGLKWRDIGGEAGRYLLWGLLMALGIWPLRLLALAADSNWSRGWITILAVIAGILIYGLLSFFFRAAHLRVLKRNRR